jgi:hypothetical protein
MSRGSLLTFSVPLAAAVTACAVLWPVFGARSRAALLQGRAAPRKVALIVAVGKYHPSVGWNDLASRRDAQLVRSSLMRHGFQSSDIHILEDERATAFAILAAVRTTLIEPSGDGDVVVFHYSGHGHRITDDNGDEPDGYDELLVPYDAPRHPPAGYRGEKHIRDDQLAALLTELRQRIGSSGDLLVSLDACFSGSGARAAMNAARGDPEPIGPSQGGRRGIDEAGGFSEQSASARSSAAMAPSTTLSASRHDELAWQTTASDGQPVGSLSLALSGALSRAGRGTTYRALFHDIQRAMAAAVINSPQAEGALDREVLGGRAVRQDPFFTNARLDKATGRLRIPAGTLLGLFEGARVEVHQPETRTPTEKTRIAAGEIVAAAPLESMATLRGSAITSAIESGWVFVTEPSFGTLQVNVRIASSASDAWAARVREALGTKRFVAVRDSDVDVIVEPSTSAGRAVVALRVASDGRTLLELDPHSAAIGEAIAQRIVEFARNRYLRALTLEAEGLRVRLELIACRLDCRASTDQCDCFERPDGGVMEGGNMVFALGDGLRLRLINEGTSPAFVSVLDLQPDGAIDLLWPHYENQGSDNRLPPKGTFVEPEPLRVAPPLGVDVIKLFASREPIDFRPITSRGFRQARPRTPLEKVFLDAFEGLRAEPTLPTGVVQTFDRAITVVEPGRMPNRGKLQ